MFPIRSGIGTMNAPSTDQTLYQSLAAAAIHEIGQQAIVDIALLFFHQHAADVYYRAESGIPIPENLETMYSGQERDEIKRSLIDAVMKFHILHPNGLGARLTPVIQYMQSGIPLNDAAMADPFINRILQTHTQYRDAVNTQNTQQLMAQLLNFVLIENLSQEQYEQLVLGSYKEPDNSVNVAVYDDGTVQCHCEFCQSFFEILDHVNTVDRDTLNPVQQVMADNYQF